MKNSIDRIALCIPNPAKTPAKPKFIRCEIMYMMSKDMMLVPLVKYNVHFSFWIALSAYL